MFNVMFSKATETFIERMNFNRPNVLRTSSVGPLMTLANVPPTRIIKESAAGRYSSPNKYLMMEEGESKSKRKKGKLMKNIHRATTEKRVVISSTFSFAFNSVMIGKKIEENVARKIIAVPDRERAML